MIAAACRHPDRHPFPYSTPTPLPGYSPAGHLEQGSYHPTSSYLLPPASTSHIPPPTPHPQLPPPTPNSIMLASKFFDDVYYNNAYYARVGGISNIEARPNKIILTSYFLHPTSYILHLPHISPSYT